MAEVIGVVNQKGGVGKTTTAVNLGAALAELGKYVLLIDLDPQANTTSHLGIEPESVEKSVYHFLIGQNSIRELIRETNIVGLHLLPSNMDVAGLTVELVNLPDREFRLADVLRKLRPYYDYIIIDCPPSLGLIAINGLVASDKVLIPVQAEYYALEGIGQLLKTMDLIQENLGAEIGILGALLTMYDLHSSLSQKIAFETQQYFPGYVFETIIPRSPELAEAPSYGSTIFQYAPRSRGARAYNQLAREVEYLTEN